MRRSTRCSRIMKSLQKQPKLRSTLILVTNLYVCSVFQYEPVIQPGSHEYLHHMTLYECRGDQAELESAAETTGSVCYDPDKPTFQCNTIAATWSLGSEVGRKLHLRSHTRTSSASIVGKFCASKARSLHLQIRENIESTGNKTNVQKFIFNDYSLYK